jgi:hypothetical protein
MKKEKYKQIVMEELRKVNSQPFFTATPDSAQDPMDWAAAKAQLLTFIKEVDKATEVYNLENGKEGA